jgi:hypothetical protein
MDQPISQKRYYQSHHLQPNIHQMDVVVPKVGLFAGYQRKHGVLDVFNKRATTRSVSKTSLHPLDRHDEGMKGHINMTR